MSKRIDRLTVSRGPAVVTYKGAHFYSREDITVDLTQETNEIPSSFAGKLTEVVTSVKGTCSFIPVGEVQDLSISHPYASTLPGTSIFGASDFPLLIQPLDTTQEQVTFHAAGINQMPNLRFSARDTLFASELGFQMVGKNNTPVDEADRLFTFASNALGSSFYYDDADLIIQAYANRWLSGSVEFTLTQNAVTTAAIAYDADAAAVQAAWNATANGDVTVTGNLEDGWTLTFDSVGAQNAITGAITGAPNGSIVKVTTVTAGSGGAAGVYRVELYPWGSFQTKEGVNVTFSPEFTEDFADAIGHYDTVFSGLSVDVEMQPQGIDAESVLNACRVQGSLAVPGTRLSTGAHDLYVYGSGVHFVLYGAQLNGGKLIYGAQNNRIPPLTWKASRTVAAAALNPMFYLDTSAPA